MTTNIVFKDENFTFNENEFDNKVIIFSERNGRKCNTYIVDWNIEKSDLKNHLKNLKRKHGCNGSIKNKMFHGEEKEVLHLQGEWKSQVKEYLLDNNINEENIEIKV